MVNLSKIQIDPPQVAEDFFESLEEKGEEIDPKAPLIWLKHPTKPGQWMVAVPVTGVKRNDNES